MERSQAELRCSVERLKRELAERDEMLDFMSRRAELEEGQEMEIRNKDAEEVLGEDVDNEGDSSDDYSWMGRIRAPEGMDPVSEACYVDRGEGFEKMAMMYFRENGFGPDFLPPSEISKRWMESPKGGWQVRILGAFPI
ncbi:hypothetical protein MA16_Dca028820 [Dendrobium catenatum]|uniref:Uncharacterized protein n=1 Tax=Dendrobium catenatum TaxID=906689 RepID=A0A2I0VGD0_9ASPA|nr:hypothetical protein MA16_Dca028820 [Dendrobium catenatum]